MSLTIQQIVELTGGRLLGSAGDDPIHGVSTVPLAGPGELTFLVNETFAERFRAALTDCKASLILTFRELTGVNVPQIVHPAPYQALLPVIHALYPARKLSGGVSPAAHVAPDASLGADVQVGPGASIGARSRLGDGCQIHPNVVIGEDCELGSGCTIHPNATIYAGCKLGKRVVVHAGTVIGADGFGYLQHDGVHHKIPQVGDVIIEDDVEIGANVCIDRATLASTIIGAGTKIDNLVQIAHNAVIGRHSIIIGQAGISGSTKLGKHVVVGGQAGIGGHLDIGDAVMIAAKSAVHNDIPAGSKWGGIPAMPATEWRRNLAAMKRIRDIRAGLRDLTRRLEAHERRVQAEPKDGGTSEER